ncbi:exocyst complex component EXO70H1-like [Actinidia eriantha]|uniref:exocyst complex component EXO70H1-like n=1 Tax=Actinidia eriantha TaxID=165200 RepID=UPI002591274F|nr:exocyst complex component EXO70H1-like [Actinidia eriantha]
MGVLEIRRKESPKMASKGSASLFSFKTSSSLSTSSLSMPHIPPSPTHSFSQSMMVENIENAEALITKWDPNGSSYTKFAFLFQESRKEAKVFLKCVKDLRRAMHFLVSEKTVSDKLVLAQNLMQIAMKRLEKEFYHILSANRQYLDPESVSSRSSRTLGWSRSRSSESDDEEYGGFDEEVHTVSESISEGERLSELAMSDLKSIADCMISSGYGKECVRIYIIIRKSIVDEELYRLGIERYSSSTINKMNSETSEHHIKNWLNATKSAIKTLFNGERVLCDHVFSVSDKIRESCFTGSTKEGAINFFRFPELVAKSKRSPDKIFRLMDLYESISDYWPEIELIFSFESISAVRLQALNSLLKLGDSVRIILSEFELSIQKNSSKTLVLGGGIHPLTNSVMNYVSFLANYSGVLTEIITDSTSPTQTLLPESYFESPNSDESPTPAIAVRLVWIILVLLCKLDSKAELYNDIALSYLFLANNIQFVIEKVCTTNLKFLLGDDWVAKHDKKVKQYAANYEAMAWAKVLSTLPENSSGEMSPETVKWCFRQFNVAFEQAYQKQLSWVVPDGKLRDEIKVSISKNLVPAYREFYDTHLVTLSEEKNLEVLVRFSPDNLGNYLSDLFHGNAISGSSSLPLSPSASESRVSRCLP